MKRIFLFLISFILFFSCSTDDTLLEFNQDISSHSATFDKKKSQKISKQFFIYGVKSYTIDQDGIINFDTYRDFSINNYVGNLKDYRFVFKNDVLIMNDYYSIGFRNKQIYVSTPMENYIYNQDLSFRTLNFETKILMTVFFELYMSEYFKADFDTYIVNKPDVPCSWMDTHYVSGFGYTQEAAWSDYEYEMENSDIPKRCKSIGKPRIKSMYINLGFTQVDFYQVDHPFCCN